MLYLFLYLIFTSIILLLPGRKNSLVLTGILISVSIFLSSWLSLAVLISPAMTPAEQTGWMGVLCSGSISCDKLSALFILIINFTVGTGFIYSTGYLKPYLSGRPVLWIKLHYLALVWLHVSMILVVLFRSGFNFLIVWEIMTLSSFILVIFDFDKKGTLQAGISYLVQMHIGMLFILFAFLISSKGSETVSFDNLTTFFNSNPNWPVFLLFFIGFGLKSGFVLLHTWLPEAHPAAPSHVSGIMSGVMIKLGIYGILRVSMYLHSDMYLIGTGLILISAFTGLYGVMMAIFQHDVKKLLAYHSIENIGIIGLGIGLGIFGNATGNTLISVAGFAGAILHTLNHSLFKSLLFYSAGSVISRLHTQDVEKMGGLIKYMPYTATAFLIGSVAICGLPPFNGFVSEFLVYFSLFSGISDPVFYQLLVFSIAMISLVLIGGLAIFCFTKVFSVVFLGQPRTGYSVKPAEVEKTMILAKILPVIPILFIGIAPVLVIPPLTLMTQSLFSPGLSFDPEIVSSPARYITVIALLLTGVVLFIWALRKAGSRKKVTTIAPTWGCGYTAVDAKQQYTATSFVQEYASLMQPFIKNGATNITYGDEEIFPGERDFHTSSTDFFKSKIIMRFANFTVNIFRRMAVLQTGKLQHYVLYALLFLVLILLLTFLELI